MQAKIKFSKSVYSILYYHERKQQLKVAECITAGNFAKEVGQLDFEDKQYHLERLTSLNEAVTNRILHICLSFHPSEQLSNGKLTGLAEEYLRDMKLDHQPYLVYRHHDTLHPHLHLVLPGVQKDATRVHLTPADYHRSYNITQELRMKHKLTPAPTAEERRQRQGQALKVRYHEMPLQPAIDNVLKKVLDVYKFKDLEELNAVLRMYNVQAWRGKENSPMYRLQGLAYRALDDNGKPLFGQIKASAFDEKPTLPKLEKLMVLHQAEEQRLQHRQRVTTLLGWHTTKRNMDLPALGKALQREQISMVWMDQKQGVPQKIFYVDHVTRGVFSGRDLGYDAADLRLRLAPVQVQEQKQELQQRQRHRIRFEL